MLAGAVFGVGCLTSVVSRVTTTVADQVTLLVQTCHLADVNVVSVATVG
jgi:hypothetical protein